MHDRHITRLTRPDHLVDARWCTRPEHPADAPPQQLRGDLGADAFLRRDQEHRRAPTRVQPARRNSITTSGSPERHPFFLFIAVLRRRDQRAGRGGRSDIRRNRFRGGPSAASRFAADEGVVDHVVKFPPAAASNPMVMGWPQSGDARAHTVVRAQVLPEPRTTAMRFFEAPDQNPPGQVNILVDHVVGILFGLAALAMFGISGATPAPLGQSAGQADVSAS